MVSTLKKKRSNRRLLSQVDDFYQNFLIGNTIRDRQQNATVNEGTIYQKFTVNIYGSDSAANENLVKVRTLERWFYEKTDNEMGNIVDTVEDRTQNAILTAIDSNITLKIELPSQSINASSRQNVTSVIANSERGKDIFFTLLEIVSERNNTLHVFNTNEETQINIPDEVSELPVPRTHPDRQPHTHLRNLTFSVAFFREFATICSKIILTFSSLSKLADVTWTQLANIGY